MHKYTLELRPDELDIGSIGTAPVLSSFQMLRNPEIRICRHTKVEQLK
jgi:hypothetical protein